MTAIFGRQAIQPVGWFQLPVLIHCRYTGWPQSACLNWCDTHYRYNIAFLLAWATLQIRRNRDDDESTLKLEVDSPSSWWLKATIDQKTLTGEKDRKFYSWAAVYFVCNILSPDLLLLRWGCSTLRSFNLPLVSRLCLYFCKPMLWRPPLRYRGKREQACMSHY